MQLYEYFKTLYTYMYADIVCLVRLRARWRIGSLRPQTVASKAIILELYYKISPYRSSVHGQHINGSL